MAKHPKSSRQPTVVAAPPPRTAKVLLRAVPEFVSKNIEGLLLALAVFHILLFLVFLGSLAISSSGGVARPQPFGQGTTQTAPEPPEPDEVVETKAITKTGAASFAAFSVVLWGVLLFWRRTISDRVFRFLVLMLAPGTVMAAVAVFHAWRT